MPTTLRSRLIRLAIACLTAIVALVPLAQLGGGVAHASGGFSERAPFVISSFGRQNIFVTGTDGQVRLKVQLSPNGNWPVPSAWINLGKPLGMVVAAQPAAIRDVQGRLSVFVTTRTGSVFRLRQAIADPSGYHWERDWHGLFDTSDPAATNDYLIGQPLVLANQDGRAQVFVRNADGTVFSSWQASTDIDTWSWSPWFEFHGPKIASDLTGSTDGYHRLHIFGQGVDAAIYTWSQMSPNGGWFSSQRLGGNVLGRPTVLWNYNGLLQIFAIGWDHTLYSRVESYNGPTSEVWRDWVSYGGRDLGSDVSAGIDPLGRGTIVVTGGDGAVYTKHQVAYAPAAADLAKPWSDWSSLAGNFDGQPALGNNADQRLQVFVAGGFGSSIYSTWTNPSGWAAWAFFGANSIV